MMISEYHINLLLDKLKKIIENQNELLYELREFRESRKPPVAKELPKDNWSVPEKQESSEKTVSEKVKGTFSDLKEKYRFYKKNGGTLKWNEWHKAGRPNPCSKTIKIVKGG